MKTFKQFYEEIGAGVVSGGASNTSPIANVTGSMVQTDLPVINPKKKKPPIVRRKQPI